MANSTILHIKDNFSKTYVSYRIRVKASDLKPSWLTNTIGIAPSWEFAAGEEYLAKRPNGTGGWKEVTSTRPFGVWGLTTKQIVDSNKLERHCEYLTNILEPKRSVLRELVDKPELFDIGLLFRVETTNYILSDTISSSFLSLLAELSHFIDISTIFTGEDNINE